MAGFHIPGDPYFLNQGNGGRIEDNHEEELENEDFEEDSEEEIEGESDAESEVINQSYIARVPAEVMATQLRRLDQDFDQSQEIINNLQEDLTTARAETREYQERNGALKERVFRVEHRVEEMQTFMASFHGLQNNTRRE